MIFGQWKFLHLTSSHSASGNTQLTLSGIANDGNFKLISTLRKNNITPKIKTKNLAKNIVLRNSTDPGSGIGATTLNDGLTYGTYPYGTRVQDKIISLNEPDVLFVYGIFVGDGSDSDPESPSMTVGSMDGPTSTTNDLILGEEIVGSVSGARQFMLIGNQTLLSILSMKTSLHSDPMK